MPHIEFETHTVAVISTSHITEKDDEILGNGRHGLVVDEHAYGYRVYLSPDDFMEHDLPMWKDNGASKHLRRILKSAWKQGYRWIEFDTDGSEIDGLAQFDW